MIWGWQDMDILPVRFFVVARDIGGQLLGAFDDNFMCGFCVAIPGVHPGAPPYLHSHMLGVLPEYRNAGAGRMLKLAQREDALARGFELVEWTFDPLELKNAYFNIEKLGAVIRQYLPNHYGITTSSLGGGLPTDRCLAEWHLNRLARRSQHALASPCPPASIVSGAPIPTRCFRSSSKSRASFSRTSRADSPSPALSAPPTPVPTCFHHGLPNRPHRSPPDPDAAGAFL